MATSFQVTFDCADPDKLMKFWTAALGYKKQDPPPGFDSWEAWMESVQIPQEERDNISAAVDPAGVGPRLLFLKVPEAKTVKNRVHLDVNVGGDYSTPPQERRQRVETEVERLVAAGATKIRAMEENTSAWVVMSDPEGNEFCLQ